MEVSLEAYRAAIGLFNCFLIRCFKFVYSLSHTDAALTFHGLNSVSFLNARSLNVGDQFEEISLLVRVNEFDVFAVTETWLNDRVSSDCLQIAGYNPIIRLHRHYSMGGGVAFFTVNTLVAKRRLDV